MLRKGCQRKELAGREISGAPTMTLEPCPSVQSHKSRPDGTDESSVFCAFIGFVETFEGYGSQISWWSWDSPGCGWSVNPATCRLSGWASALRTPRVRERGWGTAWGFLSQLLNWVYSSKDNILVFFFSPVSSGNPAGLRSSLGCCMFSSSPGLAKGRESFQMLAYEQALIAMGELVAQNWALGCNGIKEGWKRTEGEEVISSLVSGLPFLLGHNPFQIPLLNHECVVC